MKSTLGGVSCASREIRMRVHEKYQHAYFSCTHTSLGPTPFPNSSNYAGQGRRNRYGHYGHGRTTFSAVHLYNRAVNIAIIPAESVCRAMLLPEKRVTLQQPGAGMEGCGLVSRSRASRALIAQGGRSTWYIRISYAAY